MYCDQFEKLIDAHLDGELAGALRLEFDAHRVNCSTCEHAVTLMEAVSTVVSAPPRLQAWEGDFTNRVMAQVSQAAARPKPKVAHHGARVALVAGGLFQAAAVLALALWPENSARIPVSQAPEEINLASVTPDALTQYICESVAMRLSQNSSFVPELDQLRTLAMSLNVGERTTLDPVGLLQAWLPKPADAPSHAEKPNQFSF